MHPIFLTTLTSLAPAFELLLTGMLTVAIVLSLVVLAGQLLIRFVNRYTKVVAKASLLSPPTTNPSDFPPEVLAVLSAAVEVATHGQGQITSIEKP